MLTRRKQTFHINSSGFGAIGVLVVLVVAGGIGFTGWRIYSATHVKKTTSISKATDTKSEPTPPKPLDTSGWKEYKDDIYSLRYPERMVVYTTDSQTGDSHTVIIKDQQKDVALSIVSNNTNDLCSIFYGYTDVSIKRSTQQINNANFELEEFIKDNRLIYMCMKLTQQGKTYTIFTSLSSSDTNKTKSINEYREEFLEIIKSLKVL